MIVGVSEVERARVGMAKSALLRKVRMRQWRAVRSQISAASLTGQNIVAASQGGRVVFASEKVGSR